MPLIWVHIDLLQGHIYQRQMLVSCKVCSPKELTCQWATACKACRVTYLSNSCFLSQLLFRSYCKLAHHHGVLYIHEHPDPARLLRHTFFSFTPSQRASQSNVRTFLQRTDQDNAYMNRRQGVHEVAELAGDLRDGLVGPPRRWRQDGGRPPRRRLP